MREQINMSTNKNKLCNYLYLFILFVRSIELVKLLLMKYFCNVTMTLPVNENIGNETIDLLLRSFSEIIN